MKIQKTVIMSVLIIIHGLHGVENYAVSPEITVDKTEKNECDELGDIFEQALVDEAFAEQFEVVPMPWWQAFLFRIGGRLFSWSIAIKDKVQHCWYWATALITLKYFKNRAAMRRQGFHNTDVRSAV